MTESNNKEEEKQQIANEFFEVWQKQLQSMIVNPDISFESSGDVYSKMFDLQQQMMKNTSNINPNIYKDIINKDAFEGSNVSGKNVKDDTDISKHDDDELHRLKCRVAACEARISALEARIKD